MVLPLYVNGVTASTNAVPLKGAVQFVLGVKSNGLINGNWLSSWITTVSVPLQPVEVKVTSTMKLAAGPPCFPLMPVVANVPLINAPGAPTVVPAYQRYS